MYDQQTESLWPQLSFTASVGVLTGTKLVPHLTSLLAWNDFRETRVVGIQYETGDGTYPRSTANG